MTSADTPIACTLGAADYKDRLALIADLNARALQSAVRDDLTLILTYDRSAAGEVGSMVKAEQACCAFLSFQTEETADGLRLTITAPPEAREAAEQLFEPFSSVAQ